MNESNRRMCGHLWSQVLSTSKLLALFVCGVLPCLCGSDGASADLNIPNRLSGFHVSCAIPTMSPERVPVLDADCVERNEMSRLIPESDCHIRFCRRGQEN